MKGPPVDQNYIDSLDGLGEPDGKVAAAPHVKALTPEFSEDRLALDFADKHSHDLRYVAAWGKWLAWTRTHWEFENTLRVFDLARKICRDAAFQCDKPSEAKALSKAKTVAAVEMLSRSDRKIAATKDQWDTNLGKLNTKGEGDHAR